LLLLVMVCVIAIYDLFLKSPQRHATHYLTLLTLAGAAFLTGSARSAARPSAVLAAWW